MVSGGGVIASACVAITADGGFIAAPAGRLLHIFSARTGQRVALVGAHAAAITGLCLHPRHGGQAYTASLDGTLKLWELPACTLLKTITIGQPLHGLVAPRGQDSLLLLLRRADQPAAKSKQSSALRVFDIRSEQLQEPSLKLHGAAAVATSGDGEVAGVADSRKVSLWRTRDGWRTQLKLHHTKNLQCLAVDATGSRAAAGDVTGRVLVWHGLRTALAELGAGREPRQPACTTLHWHAHAVACLAFSPDATQLLSGGEEAVLVAWQLGSNAKRFLPRLSGRLLRCEPFPGDSGRYLVAQGDNTLRVLNLASMQVELAIRGLRLQPAVGSGGRLALAAALAPSSGLLVAATERAGLQVYDLLRDCQADHVQVSESNPTVGSQLGQASNAAAEERVAHLCLSSDGSRLATLAAGPAVGAGAGVAQRLAFWERSAGPAGQHLYQQQTAVDGPHPGAVTGIAYHPSRDWLASVGAEGQLRVWQAAGSSWRCRLVATHQGLPMHSVAFSPDGSLLATGTGGGVALWSPETGAFLTSLQPPGPPAADAAVTQLAFVPGTPLLAGAVAGGQEQLVVWSLLEAAVRWWLPAPVQALAAAPSGCCGLLAVSLASPGEAAQGTVALLQASDARALQVWTLPGSTAPALLFPPPGSPLHAAGQAVAPEGTAPLLILTDGCTYTIGKRPGAGGEASKERGLPIELQVSSEEGWQPERPEQMASPSTEGATAAAAIGRPLPSLQRLLDAPTHGFSPLALLSAAFCEALVCSDVGRNAGELAHS